MSASHHFKLQKIAPQKVYENGTRIDVNQKIFSQLSGMALSYLTLNPHAAREPHWHPNAHELGYCLEGKALMTIFSPGAGHDTFIIEPGTLSFVPMGYMHNIQNIGDVPCKILICFSNDMPEDLNLSSTLGMVPFNALASTLGVNESFLKGLNPSIKPAFINESHQPVSLDNAWQTNRFKMNLAGIQPQIKNKGGAVRINNHAYMPTLEGLTMYNLKLEVKGVREPHWHPNAHELNFLVNGRARISLLSPGEQVDSFEMESGDISFLPKGYYHYIENIGDEPLQFAIFFNHTMPSDLGLSGCLGAYSNAVLADLFKVDSSYFDSMPKYQEDLFIVAGGG